MSKSMRYSRRLPYKYPGATHERYSGCDVISNYSVTLTHIHSIILDENAYYSARSTGVNWSYTLCVQLCALAADYRVFLWSREPA